MTFGLLFRELIQKYKKRDKCKRDFIYYYQLEDELKKMEKHRMAFFQMIEECKSRYDNLFELLKRNGLKYFQTFMWITTDTTSDTDLPILYEKPSFDYIRNVYSCNVELYCAIVDEEADTDDEDLIPYAGTSFTCCKFARGKDIKYWTRYYSSGNAFQKWLYQAVEEAIKLKKDGVDPKSLEQ